LIGIQAAVVVPESIFIKSCATELNTLAFSNSYVQRSSNGFWLSGVEDRSEKKTWTTKEIEEANVKSYQATM